MRLTDRFVKAVKPELERVVYHDELQPGFVVVVEPSGFRSYKLIYRFGDRPRWYSIAPCRSIGLADARKMARRLLAGVVMGTDPQVEKVAARKAGSLEELAAMYVDQHAKRRNRSWREADSLIRQYVLPDLGRRKVRDIARGDMRLIINRLTDDGAPTLANRVLAHASAIFSWAIKNEIADVAANPCHGVERNKTDARERVLSDAEVPPFWRAFDEAGLVRASALRMILLTGQRPGEVRHMRREHLEIGTHRFTDANGRAFEAEGAWWNLPGKPDPKLGWPGTKNGQSHRVWLPKAAVAIVEELDEGKGGFVFAGPRGRPFHQLDDVMRVVCEQVGIKRPDKVTPHDLRRTHGTTVTSLGFTREQMNRIQNHKEGGIGSVYDRFGYADEMRRIQEAVSAKIMTLIGGEAESKRVVRLRR
jgi:integrase